MKRPRFEILENYLFSSIEFSIRVQSIFERTDSAQSKLGNMRESSETPQLARVWPSETMRIVANAKGTVLGQLRESSENPGSCIRKSARIIVTPKGPVLGKPRESSEIQGPGL